MLSSLMILDLHINFVDGARIHPFFSSFNIPSRHVHTPEPTLH